MILRALCDYYRRNGKYPPLGMELKEIGFIIVLDKEGKFLRFEDRRIDKKSAQRFLVKRSVGRTSAPDPNYLYDNSQYVFGYSNKDTDKYFNSFKEKIEEIYKKVPDDEMMKALHIFYRQEPSCMIGTMRNDPLWDDIVKSLNKQYSIFSFLIEGDTEIVATKKKLIDLENDDEQSVEKICLVTGKRSKTVKTTTATMILGSQATAKLVAFKDDSGYDSYGKKQGYNAPISVEAEFEYTTALNHLLRPDSHNKFMIGNRTYLFWASSNSEASKKSEDSVFGLLGRSKEEDEDPNRRIELVRRTFEAIYNGELSADKDDRFFILGLAPNAARIAVVYWNETPLRKFAGLISKHFEDMEMVDTRQAKKPYVGLHSILGSVTLGGKSSDVTPNLPDAVVKSIFQGLPYPVSLFQSCIRRIRAEQSVNIVRAAIIKAYLNRLNDSDNKKINIMLDKENNNQGYLCGRLFAVLENLQYAANQQDSIRTNYMNSASSTPATVFSTILKLSNNHYSKLAKEKKGLANFYDNQKKEIMDLIQDFPSTLSLNDQGRFFLGYYHQKNNKENKETE